MDRKKFIELLKNLQNIMRCPSCGSIYNIDEMNFIGNKDGYLLLSMTCTSCALPVWVNFFAGTQPKISTDLNVSELERLSAEPISHDEVIEFHRFIKNFDGNFKKYLK